MVDPRAGQHASSVPCTEEAGHQMPSLDSETCLTQSTQGGAATPYVHKNLPRMFKSDTSSDVLTQGLSAVLPTQSERLTTTPTTGAWNIQPTATLHHLSIPSRQAVLPSLAGSVTIQQSTHLQILGCISTATIPVLSQHEGMLAPAPAGPPCAQITAWPAAVVTATSLDASFNHINHSCNPNCKLVANVGNCTYTLTAIQAIKRGSELTIDYTVAGAFQLLFQCRCGSAS
jgi:hypothetical protein